MMFEGDTEPTPPDGRVTVGRYESPSEAQIVKGMLESAGIECFLVGENANSMMPAAFRVRVQVAVEDEAAARGLIEGTADDKPAEGLAD